MTYNHPERDNCDRADHIHPHYTYVYVRTLLPGGGPSKLRLGGGFDLFHHKRAVQIITDNHPPAVDNGDRPVWQGRAVPVNQDGPRSCPAPPVGAL